MAESESVTSGQVLFGGFPLFIGDKAFAMDRRRLRKLNIRYIVNTTPPLTSGGVANFFEKEREVEYLRVPMRDVNTESVLDHLPKAIEFLDRARIRADGAVLVHCNEGKSRSCAVTVGFLVRTHGRTLAEALELVRAARPIAEPKEAFLAQLGTLEPAVLPGVDTDGCRARGKRRAADADSDAGAKRPAIGPQGPPQRAGIGPQGPPERGAIGPQGPPQRDAIGPQGPPERGAIGPQGPPERDAIGPQGPPQRGAIVGPGAEAAEADDDSEPGAARPLARPAIGPAIGPAVGPARGPVAHSS
jgi:hypothetical protein